MNAYSRFSRALAVAAAALCLSALTVHEARAGCSNTDRWTGQDKAMHFGIGGIIGMATTMGTGSRWTGFAAGTAVGLLKELDDRNGNGQCSAKDFLVTALGAAAGAQLGGWIVERRGRETFVGYRWELQ